VWGITQPKKDLLNVALTNIMTDPTTNNTATCYLEMKFGRDTSASITATYR